MTSTDLVRFSDPENDTTAPRKQHVITQAGKILGLDLGEVFDQIEWAEDEIARAQARFPRSSDRLFHSFTLLRPRDLLTRASTEFVYRSHCRELLDRVAAGEDTRPGTAAEICCVVSEVSKEVVLTSSAAGLYMRMWTTAGFPALDEFTEASGHHEALEKSTIDDHEAYARRKLADHERVQGAIECMGRHHGEQVDCSFTPPGQLALIA